MSLFPNATDRLFAKFCRDGDANALGQVFDRTAAELLRIACFLVGQRSDAEDLVQRTFLAAIESRTSFRRGQRAVPWLCGILANLARQLRRERARSSPPTDDQLVDPVAEAAQRELAERLARLRAELGEPYAAVVQLHLEQGFNAKEIAARLQRPAGTVRTQLMRALTLLRQRLPDGFVTGGAFVFLRHAAVTDGAWLGAMRTRVVHAARLACPAAAVAPVALFGSLFMSKNLLAAASLLLGVSLLGGWLAWPSRASDPSPPPSREAASPARAALPDAAAANATPIAAPRTEVADPRRALDDPGFAVMRVLVRWSASEPAAGIGVFASNGHRTTRRDAVSDAQGIAELPHLVPGEWSVSTTLGHAGPLADESQPLLVTLAAGEVRTLEIAVGKLAIARGRVVDEHEQPIAGAAIWMSTTGDHALGHEVTTSAADGTFCVPIAGSHSLSARMAGFAPSLTEITNPLAAAAGEIVLRLDHRGGSLRGKVDDARGTAIAWAKVLVGDDLATPLDSTSLPTAKPWKSRGVEVASDRDGRFELRGLPVGLLELRVLAPGFAPARTGVEITAGAATEQVVVMTPGASVQGTVRDPSGKPLADALVRCNQAHDFAEAHQRTAADGTFRLDDLPTGSVRLQAEAGGAACEQLLTLATGQVATWDPVLAAERPIAGTVCTVDGRGQGSLEVSAHAEDNHQLAWATTDEQGHFVLRSVGAEPVRLVIERALEVVATIDHVAPGRDDVVITLAAEQLPSAYLVGRVVDERGTGVDANLTPWRQGIDQARTWRSDAATGAFRLGPLVPGHYRIEVDSAALGRARLGECDVAMGETRTLADHVMATPGAARFRVTMLGRPANGGTVQLRRPDLAWNDSCTVDQGFATHTALPPGLVYVEVHYQGLFAATQITIVAGQTAQADLELQPTHRATVLVPGVVAADVAKLPLLVAHRADDSFAGLGGALVVDGVPQYWLDLPVGVYTLRATFDHERPAAVEVDLRQGRVTTTLTVPSR